MAVPILFICCVLYVPSLSAAPPFCGDNKCTGGETAASCPDDCAADVCGDGICGPTEDQVSCADDCGTSSDVCGDGICGSTESTATCSADCPAPFCNNDGVCNAGEDCTGCADCPGKTGGNPKNRYCCGADNYCDMAVCGANACDPVPVCGNDILEYGEECDDGNSIAGDGCDAFCVVEPLAAPVPLNQFNVGDSIGEGEAADGTIGSSNHQTVWSTGYASGDSVNSLNERFEALDGAAYAENNSTRDAAINQAVSGDTMADFASQASAVAAQMSSIPPGTAGMVTVLLGNNDVCADSMDQMTDPAVFEQEYRAGLDVLAQAPYSDSVNVQISGIPAIYWLWNAKRSDFWCRAFVWPFVPCQNLLANAGDDCASDASREDPDKVYVGDGPNCQRRKAFHARIRDEYNPRLRNVLDEYHANGELLNAEYVDIFDVRFGSQQVNGGDCFHPSEAGHSLLAEKEWCRSRWGKDDPACTTP